MSIHQERSVHAPIVLPFPQPGVLVRLAYREINVAANGTPEEQKALGPHALLPRPWDPDSCTEPALRRELWHWLDQVVIWLNHEYTWDNGALVPPCWPEHPHLVHEIAVVADQRRRSGLAKTSDALEEWHRYCLPAFVDRMRSRLNGQCDDGHSPWPGRPSHSDHTDATWTQRRQLVFVGDVDELQRRHRDGHALAPPHLGLVDLETGEVLSETPPVTPRTRTRKGPHE